MTEKSAFEELYGNKVPEVTEVNKEDIPPAAAEITVETVVETPAVEVTPSKPVEDVKVEKGWLGRSKDAIARSSENFLKRIAVGALESFDKNVTSRLSAGPARQIEKHNANIAKNEKAMAALNELLKNLPEGYAREKGLKSLQKFEDGRDSSKNKLETATERFNKRNKWHEGVLNTRNEFLQAVADNYKTVEDAKMEQVAPLEKKLEVCNRLKSIMGERNKARDDDNSAMISELAIFKDKLKGIYSESEIMNLPAIKEIQKNIEKNNDAKVKDLENLKKHEDKIRSKYLDKKGKYDAVAQKRKNCEASIAKKTEKEFEATPDSISEVAPEITAEIKQESNESEPKLSVGSQVELWNSFIPNDSLLRLDTIEISARAFKAENETLTKDDFVNTIRPILVSRGVPSDSIDDLAKALKTKV